LSNLVKTLTKRSLKILKKDGFRGLITSRKNYYESYPPIRHHFYYWLYSKLKLKRTIVREIQGSKMFLNLDDFGLSKYLFLNGIREPECTRIFKQQLKEGMVIADIGANIGYYALMEANIIGDKGKIYAIEPFPSNYNLLLENIKLNSYGNIIEPYNLAISNKSGKEKLYISERHNCCNMMGSNNLDHVEVQTETLDNFMINKQLFDYIRMDIEGFEYYVLNGMKETLKKCKCKMFIEVHPYQMYEKGLDYKKPLKMLFSLGFHPTYIIKEHGPLKEEAFEYKKPVESFFSYLEELELSPPKNTHGFGLFLEK